jgi:hypothetical protein
LIIALTVLMALEVFNPAQGGLTVGFAGILFYVIPISWYWIGQAFGSPEFLYKLLRRIVVPLAVLAAILGLIQTLYGFLHFESLWFHLTGAGSIYVENRRRAFGFFVSPAEYCMYLTVEIVVVISPLLIGKFRIESIALPLLCVAVFLFGGRGPLITVIVSICVIWAITARNARLAILRFGAAVALCGVGLVFALRGLQNADVSEQIRPFVDRNVQLVSDPSQTTAGIHWEMFAEGIKEGLKHPLGSGLGATTPAAGRYGGTGGNSEIDVSNMFITLGVLGGVLYVVIVGWTLYVGFSYFQLSHSLIALFVAGILILLIAQWSSGGMYSLAALVWFCIGSIDRARQSRLSSSVPEEPQYFPGDLGNRIPA